MRSVLEKTDGRIFMGLSIGNAVLGDRPLIAAIIDRKLPLAEIQLLPAKGADMLEIRADLLGMPAEELQEYTGNIKKTVDSPLIGTIRETDENSRYRLSLFELLIPLVDSIDIEIDSAINSEVIAMAKDKPVIVSDHDFEKTPSDSALQSIAEKGTELGGSIIKIAAMATCRRDVIRLLRFTESCACNLVTIAMGETGTVSRVIAPLFGSLFTYAFIGGAVAPGQLSLDKMAEQISLFYPGSRPPGGQ
ncbi:MAG: type I 3-dehydroquinate dehydratase [Chitinivibrionales bacterium]|nr:type I 3-dehydroquinate dehydratase [Chitinivibrionales bacterium]